MKKIYRLEDLDCANCAAKMENAIQKLDGVKSASVSFIMQKLTIETEDSANPQSVIDDVKKCVARVEPDCRIIGA